MADNYYYMYLIAVESSNSVTTNSSYPSSSYATTRCELFVKVNYSPSDIKLLGTSQENQENNNYGCISTMRLYFQVTTFISAEFLDSMERFDIDLGTTGA